MRVLLAVWNSSPLRSSSAATSSETGAGAPARHPAIARDSTRQRHRGARALARQWVWPSAKSSLPAPGAICTIPVPSSSLTSSHGRRDARLGLRLKRVKWASIPPARQFGAGRAPQLCSTCRCEVSRLKGWASRRLSSPARNSGHPLSHLSSGLVLGLLFGRPVVLVSGSTRTYTELGVHGGGDIGRQRPKGRRPG